MISNDPVNFRKNIPSYILWENLFVENELNDIEKLCQKEELHRSTTVGKGEDCEQHRKSKVKFISRNEENYWIFDKFNGVIDRINSTYFGFDLYGYKDFQYTVYDSLNKGMYDWHMDTVLGDNDCTDSVRKLTLVMLLSEPQVHFSGGEFQINLGMEEDARTPEMTRGKIIAFPSFLIHRVKPVHLGIRKSIVIWVEGPKFR